MKIIQIAEEIFEVPESVNIRGNYQLLKSLEKPHQDWVFNKDTLEYEEPSEVEE
jgi:hypothetical protein